MAYWSILTRIRNFLETSMNEFKSIKQYSKLISIEHTWMNQVDWHFEVLEYLNTINIQYSEILSNVTERGYSKLHPSELIMDVRFGRSTFNHFESFHYYFALSMNMNHLSISHILHHNRVKWIVMMVDLFKSFHSNSFNTLDYCW